MPDKKLTDNEIIKALECCSVALMYDEEQSLYRQALDLINRQKAEIERLNGCVKSEEEVRAIMKSQMMPMVNEIVNEQFDVAVKLARAEAIKEFAERLESKLANNTDISAVGYQSIIAEVDNLVKEMEGNDNED